MNKADEYKFRKSRHEMRELMERSNRRINRMLMSVAMVVVTGLMLIFA